MTCETETPYAAPLAEAGQAADQTPPKPHDTQAADVAADRAAGQAPCRPEEGRPRPPKQKPGEIGGPAGPEPTRYGDWEVGGRCSDF